MWSMTGANMTNNLAHHHFCENTIAFHGREFGGRRFPFINNRFFQTKMISDFCRQQLYGTKKNTFVSGGGFINDDDGDLF
jgi:glycerol-3-phosphate dehydrogenase